MTTLFIDTSSHSLSIGLIVDGLVYEKKISAINEHSKYASAFIEELFKDNNIKPEEINQIMVTNGPGSFTGLRIGVTIAKVYAWALNKNVIPISTLKAYALSQHNSDYYISIIDARRDYLFAAIYDKNYNEILKETYISKLELLDIIDKLDGDKLIIGDISINKNISFINPNLNIKRIYDYYKEVDGINPHKLNPNYLKKVEAEERLGDNND